MRVMGTRLSFGSVKVAARDRAAFARRERKQRGSFRDTRAASQRASSIIG